MHVAEDNVKLDPKNDKHMYNAMLKLWKVVSGTCII